MPTSPVAPMLARSNFTLVVFVQDRARLPGYNRIIETTITAMDEQQKGHKMSRILVSMFMTLDGVIEEPMWSLQSYCTGAVSLVYHPEGKA
jgi:hypothetical protein